MLPANNGIFSVGDHNDIMGQPPCNSSLFSSGIIEYGNECAKAFPVYFKKTALTMVGTVLEIMLEYLLAPAELSDKTSSAKDTSHTEIALTGKDNPGTVHKIKLFATEASLNSLLSELHRFVSPDDMIRLEAVAQNQDYEKKLSSLLKDGLISKLYYSEDTCNTLCWGLMNGKLTQEEFTDHYHFLMLIFFFFPKKCQGDKLPEGEYDLATEVREITCSEICCGENYREIRGCFKPDLLKNNGEKQQYKFFEFNLTNQAKSLLANSMSNLRKNKFSKDFQQNHYLFWIHFYESHVHGVWMSDDDKKVTVASFNFFSQAVKNGTFDLVNIKPGFGAGNWDALKVMRLKEQHPVAFWHPEVSNSLIQPDGYWVGTIAHLHDFYHAYTINRLGKEKRQWYLKMDGEIILPEIKFYDRVLSEKQTKDDTIFFQILKTIPYKNNNWEELIALTIPELYKRETECRELVDQEIFSTSEITGALWALQYTSKIMLFDVPQGSMLKINLFIFQVIKNDNNALANEILDIDIEEYPEARQAINEMLGNPDSCGEISDYLEKYPLAGRKWLMDLWVRELFSLLSPTPS